MQNITSIAGLKNTIQLLEAEQAYKRQKLNEQFHIVYDSLKPSNIIMSSIKNIGSEPSLIDNFVGTAIGLVGGYISKKLVVGSSDNLFRKLFGSMLQFGVITAVTKNPAAVKSITHFIFNLISHKKETNPENP